MFARSHYLRFQNHRLPFQVLQQGMARTPTATSALGRSLCPGVVLLGVLLGGILEHILTDLLHVSRKPVKTAPQIHRRHRHEDPRGWG